MTKKISSVILSLIIVLSFIISPVYADTAYGFETAPVSISDIESAVKNVNNAIDNLNSIFTPEQASSFSQIFTGFVDICRNAGSILTAVNGSVNFLKLIGFIKDGNAENLKNIMTQVRAISEQLNDMDRKLNELTEQMSQIRASQEFNTRTEKAIMLRQNWKDFEYRYMEESMDALMTQYNSMLLNGMQAWSRATSPEARTANGIDNSELVLVYELSKGSYVPVLTAENITVSSLPGDARYIVIDSNLLPGSFQWNVNTYREYIESAIIANITERISAEGPSSVESGNFPGFSSGTAEQVSPEVISSVASDAVDLLVYRVAAAEVNGDSSFSLQVMRQFSNYCTHLFSADEGLDAMFKTMYLTHAFEYQIEDDLRSFCDEITLKTGVYGSFALDIAGMSGYVTEQEKLSVLSTYCTALNSIGEYASNCLTGRGNYCYLTNSIVSFSSMSITSSATITYKKRGYILGYEDFSASPASCSIKNTSLIGDSDALLIGYTLRSNGITPDYEYYRTHLGSSSVADYGSIVVSMNPEQVMPTTNSTLMDVTNVIGSYFSKSKTAAVSALPDDADSDDIKYRRMITGSVIDYASGSLSANKVISSIAVYGESHFYWEKDEAAFLGGPSDCKYIVHSADVKSAGTEFPSTEYFTAYYDQVIKYNCLTEKPSETVSNSALLTNPISSYLSLCDECGYHFDNAVSGAGIQHKITADETLNGIIETSSSSAHANSTVFVTVTPDKGYMLGSLEVKAKSGSIIETTTDEDGNMLFIMPEESVTVSSTFTEDPLLKDFFTDVSASDWFYDSVLWAVRNDVTKGTDNIHFSPSAPCTRAQVITFLWRLSESPVPDYALMFDDVDSEAYYADAVRWAASVGVTHGTSDTKFSPEDKITREQLAAMIYNYANIKGSGFAGEYEHPLAFSDKDTVSPWADEAMQWCVKHGIVNGLGNNRLAPKNTATRAEIVTMLYRLGLVK